MAMVDSFEVMAFGKFTLVLMLAWIGHRLLRNFNPRLLVAWWRACAAAIVLCVVSLMAPAWLIVQIPADSFGSSGTKAEAASTYCSDDSLQYSQETRTIPYVPLLSEELHGEFEPQKDSQRDAEDQQQAASFLNRTRQMDYLGESSHSELSPSQTIMAGEPRTPFSHNVLRITLVTTWGIGITVGALNWLLGWCYLLRLQARATLPNKTVLSVGNKFAASYQLNRVPRILCAPVEIPCVVGIIRPAILLPESIAHEPANWAQLKVALSHEMAHVAERDLWWDTIYRVISILAWPHPLVWRMPATHRSACERVCDLNAVDALGDRELYVTQLARMALALHANQNSPMLIGLAARPDILDRLAWLRLGKTSMRLHAGQRIALGVVPCAGLALAALSFTTVRAQQVATLQTQRDEVALSETQAGSTATATPIIAIQAQPLTPASKVPPPPNESSTPIVNPTEVPTRQLTGNTSNTQAVLAAPSYYESALRVQVGEPEENPELALVPEISGQVVSAAGKPLANVVVTVFDSVASERAERSPTKGPRNGDQQFGLLQVATSDSSGRFSFSRLRALPESNREHSEFRLKFFAVSPNEELGIQTRFVDRHVPMRTVEIGLHDVTPTHTIQYCDPRGEPIAGAKVDIFEIFTFAKKEGRMQGLGFQRCPFKLNLTTDSSGRCALPKLPRDTIWDIAFRHDDWMLRRTRVHTYSESDVPVLRRRLNEHYQHNLDDLEKQPNRSADSLQTYRAIWQNELKVVEHPLQNETRVVARGFETWQGQVVAPDSAGVAAILRFASADNIGELVKTDVEGRFSLKLPKITESESEPTNSISIQVRSDDQENYMGATHQLSAEDLRNNHPLRIELEKPRVVSGQVLTADDHQPVVGIRVFLSREVPPAKEGPYALAETTADGRFTLRLRPGTYDLHLATSTPGIDLPTTGDFPWYGNPESRPPLKIQAVEVKSDAAIELEPILVARTKPVSVRVLDASGKPVENAEVDLKRIAVWASDSGTLSPERLAPFAEPVTTDSQGRCSMYPFSSLGSEIVVIATHEQASGVFYGEKTMGYVPTTPIEIRLQPAAKITGKLTQNGVPIAAATISLSEPGRRVLSTEAGRLTTTIHERSLYNRALTETNESGEYQLIAPLGKRYQVEYSRSSSRSTTMEVVFANAKGGTANINLVSGTEIVSGTVQSPDGEPLADARVALKMPPNFKHLLGYEYRSFIADAAGRFEIPELPSGKYRVNVAHGNSNWSREQEFELEAGRPDQVLRLQSR